jgi:hypothetical protein
MVIDKVNTVAERRKKILCLEKRVVGVNIG